MKKNTAVAFIILFCIGSQLAAKDIFINNVKGNDGNDGSTEEKALCSVNKAIAMASAGDTIKVMATDMPYLGSIVFSEKSGESGNPIVFDGGLATFTGAKPLVPSEYEALDNGLYRKKITLPPNILCRYFMVFDGNICNMGRSSKGIHTQLKKSGDIKENEWTYDDKENFLYIRINTDKKLTDYKIEEVDLRNSSGVVVDNASYLTFRNIIATHFWNDGFNIHHHCEGIRFENIIAAYNGDDSISAHEDAQIFVKNLIGIGNSTGIVHVQTASSETVNALLINSTGTDILVGDKTGGIHVMKNVYSESSAPNGITAYGERFEAENCAFINKLAHPVVFYLQAAHCRLEKCQLFNYSVSLDSLDYTGQPETSLEIPCISDAMQIRENLLQTYKKVFGEKILAAYGLLDMQPISSVAKSKSSTNEFIKPPLYSEHYDFENSNPWNRIYPEPSDGVIATAELSDEQAVSGEKSVKWSVVFPGDTDKTSWRIKIFSQKISFNGQIRAIRMQIYADGSNTTVNLRVRDNTGECWYGAPFTLDWKGWRKVEWDLKKIPAGIVGGDKNKKHDSPLELVLEGSFNKPEGNKALLLYVDDLEIALEQ